MKKLYPALLAMLCLYSCAEQSTGTKAELSIPEAVTPGQTTSAIADHPSPNKKSTETYYDDAAQVDSVRSVVDSDRPADDYPERKTERRRQVIENVSQQKEGDTAGTTASQGKLNTIPEAGIQIKPGPVRSKAELFNALASMPQIHSIDPAVDNVIKGEKGISVFIPANAFVFDDGTKPASAVTISFEEFLTPADFLSRKLSSTSGRQLLETGGMVNITALAEGRQLHTDKNKAIAIRFPAAVQDAGMQTFYGDTVQDKSFTWRPVTDTDTKAGVAAIRTALKDSVMYDTTIEILGSSAEYIEDGNNGKLSRRFQDSLSAFFYRRFQADFRDSIFQSLYLNESRIQLKVRVSKSGKLTVSSKFLRNFKNIDIVKQIFSEMSLQSFKDDWRTLSRQKYSIQIGSFKQELYGVLARTATEV